MLDSTYTDRGRMALAAALLAVLALLAWSAAHGQPAGGDATAEQLGAEGEATPDTGLEAGLEAGAPGEGIDLVTLLARGGLFMIPLALLSLMAVTIILERSFGTRRQRLLPTGLVRELEQLAKHPTRFDPRQAYRVCQQYPSAAANVVRAMLLKVGRPHSEVEHTVAEISQREADRLYSNVRWLNLAAAVAPLLGLLGTVWGMIRAFHDTTQVLPGQNRADLLARGIYEALVTTLTGLMIAIPAAIFAHYFEGRIRAYFHQIHELLFNLMPSIERFEGRVRFTERGKTVPLAPPRAAEADEEPSWEQPVESDREVPGEGERRPESPSRRKTPHGKPGEARPAGADPPRPRPEPLL